MNFNSLEFLVLLLPVTLLAFYSVPAHFRLGVLIAASVVFYGASGLAVLGAFLVAILWVYGITFLFGRWPRRFVIGLAACVPVLFLVMFKYLNFILGAVQAGQEVRGYLWVFQSVLLPAGISFYTFELISYVIDVSDRKIAPDRSLQRFFAFATFFPHLIAGPIVRYANLRDQLKALQTASVLNPNIASGLKLLSVGLAVKIFVADICAVAAARAERAPLEGLSAFDQWAEIGFWSMQIYYDFWAYSVMAIGLARLLCVELPMNFREPYLSENPREFWRRWHITLSYWLRDYIYIRMGGRHAYLRNILVVFALIGLWHGAGWNFAAWGVYHGLLVVLYRATARIWDRLPRPMAIALCFFLVSLGWPLFFLSLSDYALFLLHLTRAPWEFGVYRLPHWVYLGAICAFTFCIREHNWLYNEPDRRHRLTDSPFFAAVLLFAGLLFVSLSRTFIYFRF